MSDKPKSKKRSLQESDAVPVTQDESVAVSKKKSKKSKEDEPQISVVDLSPIARPLAERKMVKKVLRTVKRASRHRQIKRGIKEVTKALRKNGKGVVVMAADISPMDVLSHMPVLCEDSNCPYIFLPSKESLGQASSTKRPTSCIMLTLETDPTKLRGNKKAIEILKETKNDPEKLKEFEEYQDSFQEVYKEAKTLNEAIAIPLT